MKAIIRQALEARKIEVEKNMKTVTVKYQDGGSDVISNVWQVAEASDGTHIFRSNTDMGINTVTVVGADGFVARHYETQSSEPSLVAKPTLLHWRSV
jgi:hypothetical protein